MTKERFEFTIEAEAEHDGIPAIVRVRRWLKEAKRMYGIKCIEGRKVETDLVTTMPGSTTSTTEGNQ